VRIESIALLAPKSWISIPNNKLAAGQDVAIFCKQTQGLRLNSEIFLLGVTKHFLPTDFIPLGKFGKL
jgi:hypothetical protein